ncbi:MAG: DUF3574 domain-containing protein [Rhizomicrobium sp.]|jgi:hypothetical protein
MLPYLLAALIATAPSQCPLPNESPMVVTQLFFGRDIAGRAPLTDVEWSDFAAGVIAKNFPDGFTVGDGQGQWLDPKTRRVVQERSKIVIVAAAPAPDLARRIEAVTDAYRLRFHQESVGALSTTECGSF